MATLNSTTINDTGYLALPVGTTAQRGTEAAGTLVYFTSVGTTSWTVPSNVDTVEVLVVGGGGGGGSDMGGGGGGGGVVYEGAYNVNAGETITVTVGGGGSGAPAGQGQVRGSNGGNSVFGSITAYGGGGGASRHDGSGAPAGDGASGGGASGGRGNGTPAANASGYGGGNRGRQIYNQGNDGAWGDGYWYPGGGGGAGQIGFTNPAHGGNGVPNNITGSIIYWGGGGGGSGYSGQGGNGGLGGGGGGAVNTTYGGNGYNNGSGGGGGGTSTWAQTPGGNAGANTGGGGGGGSHYNAGNQGGTGGSGIVIVKYNTQAGGVAPNAGSMRVNTDTGAAEFYSATGTWNSMAIPFKIRTVITHHFMAGGYKSSSAWNNVNRTTQATDTTLNLGDGSITRSFNYQGGACGKHVEFIFGAGNGHAVSSNVIVAFNMRTEQAYTGHVSQAGSYNGLNKGTVFWETYYSWTTGGGSSNIDEYNLTTETLTQTIGGWSSTNQWGMSSEHEAYFYWENDSRVWTYTTRTARSSPSGQPCNHHQQKAVQSKLNYGWAGNEGSWNGGYNLRRTNFVTHQANQGTYGKPSGNSGEENFSMGQDWQYMLGMYNGLQNNISWKWQYYTETGFQGGSTLEPKGKAGSSSGFCWWRGD